MRAGGKVIPGVDGKRKCEIPTVPEKKHLEHAPYFSQDASQDAYQDPYNSNRETIDRNKKKNHAQHPIGSPEWRSFCVRNNGTVVKLLNGPLKCVSNKLRKRTHLAAKFMDLVALEELSEFSKNQ